MPDDEPPPIKDVASPTTTSELLTAYRRMLASLFTGTIGCLILIGIPAGITAIGNYRARASTYDLPIQLFVLLCGSLGAFFSALMRLYSMDHLPAALLHSDLRGLRNGYLTLYSLVPPVTGMIGAIVLYYAFAGNLIGGDVFPKFGSIGALPQKCDSSFPGSFYWAPKASSDYAKCLVWAFIAGFSERLVPDALERIEKSKIS